MSWLLLCLDVYDNNPRLSLMMWRMENLISLIPFHIFLTWDRAYVLIACLSSESHLIILYDILLVLALRK